MPTEPLATVIYVFLLVPGIAYLFQSEKHRSSRRRSAFRETSTVVVASAVCLLIPLVIWALISIPFPALRPVLAASLSGLAVAFEAQPIEYFLGIVGYLCVATLFGFLFGTPQLQKLVADVGGKPAIERDQSGWIRAFDAMDKAVILVSLQLKSGTWIQGRLGSYSATSEDTDERALVLSGGILIRTATAQEPEPVDEGQQMVIQASEIEHMTVGYLEPPEVSN